MGIEAARRDAAEAKVGRDVVADDPANLLPCLADVAGRGPAAAGLNPREAPCRVAGQMAHEVEAVSTEDRHVLAAVAGILLAVAAEFEHVADPALGDEVLDDLDPRAVPRLVREGALDVVLAAGLDHLIGLLERLRDRLLEEDARAVFGTGEHHGMMAV